MTNEKLSIVKLGGSVITEKNKKFKVNRRALRRLAGELKPFKGNLVLIHGGGSFGHPVASRYKITSGYKKQSQLMGFSLTHRAMETLNSKVINVFLKAEFPAVSVSPQMLASMKNGKIVIMKLGNLQKLIDLGILPVLYGDCVPDFGQGINILSGDQLAVSLAPKLNVSKVVFGVDTDGVYAGSPKNNEELELLPEITPQSWKKVEPWLTSSPNTDVTGGMRKKVKELLNLAEHGIESQIVNASKPNMLKKAIEGDKSLGTRIKGIGD